ncbi:Pantoate-beta-alanine ligase [Lipomyces arxii]|uniref:Pantoate-beta-alanine ligase n=1 Tax=Lipomyces arxii TaxID=56418 RepID=UPI0034CD8DBE
MAMLSTRPVLQPGSCGLTQLFLKSPSTRRLWREYSTAETASVSEPSQQKFHIFRTIDQVRRWRKDCLLAGQTIGLVPTMGALHAGHLDLVKSSLRMNDMTIVSIFVNPSQFAPTEDLISYPQTFDADIQSLEKIDGDKKVSAVFAPKVEEMYPSGIPLEVSEQKGAFVSVHGLSEQLEGKIRPQFFRGVSTVVSKLLNIVSPDRVYFGQKDVQQTVVIKRLVKDLCYSSVVHVVPTTRDANGLALSSRNVYLSDEVRNNAAIIYTALQNGLMIYRENTSASAIKNAIIDTIAQKFDKNDIEYVSVNDVESLEEVENVHPLQGAIVSLALKVPNKYGSKTRLIDNIML